MNRLKTVLICWAIAAQFAAMSQVSHLEIPALFTDSQIDLDHIGQDTIAHQIFVGESQNFNGKLMVFLPGTGGQPGEHYSKFCTVAAEQGYRAIGLVYKNTVSISDICGTDATTNEDCSENARLEVIYGEDLSEDVQVDEANSIVNRLTKLLFYLSENFSQAQWDDFYDGSDLDWSKIVFAGHSQGGGHAALLARDHAVSRVIFFNCPSDRNNHIDTPLNQPEWFYDERQTPDSSYYAFYHQQNGGDERLAIYEMMGLTGYGEATNVDLIGSPFMYSHVLYTDSATFDEVMFTNPSCGDTPFNPHSDIIVDCEIPYAMNDENPFLDAWIHLLGNQVSNVAVFDSVDILEVNIFPNPVAEELHIVTSEPFGECQIYNLSGELLVKTEESVIDVSQLAAGLYSLRIIGRGTQSTKRIVKL